MGPWSYSYDAIGNLTTQTDALNQTLLFSYDVLNRLTRKSTGAGTVLANYGYDAFNPAQGQYGRGRRTSMSNGASGTTWTYNPRGLVSTQVISIANVGLYTASLAYDAADRVTSITYPASGEVVTQNYNAQGLLQNVLSPFYGAYASNLAYDAANRLTLFTGMPLGNNTVQTAYSYYSWQQAGGAGRLQAIRSGTSASPNALQNLTYAYDAGGNVASIADNIAGQTQTFAYDYLDRLTSAAASPGSFSYAQTYGYDAIGNLKGITDTTSGTVVTAYAYSGSQPHAVSSLTTGGNTAGQLYDANGNMTQRVVLNGGVPITYTQAWDLENQLTTVTNTTTGDVTWFRYDADGQRVKRIVSSAGSITTTVYIGPYLEIDVPGNTGGEARRPDRQLGQTDPNTPSGAVKALARPLLSPSWSLQIDSITPATNRKIGETVTVNASATNINNGGLDSIWFYINCDPNGGTGGAWWTLGSVAVSGSSASASDTINPAGPNACGSGALTGTHVVLVNAKLGAGATTGDGYDSASGRWWIYWNRDTAHREKTVYWGNPPTGSISGPTTIVRGNSATYSANANDADGNLSNIKIYVSPTSGPSWTLLSSTSCSGGSCSGSASWTPSAAGTYYVVLNAGDASGLWCSGNYNNGNDLWGAPLGAGWYDCGASDRLTVSVFDPTATPTPSPSWSLQIDSIGPVSGQTAPVHASATNYYNGGLDSIWYYINCDPNGGTGGAWWTLGSVAVSGSTASASFTINSTGPNTCGAKSLTGTHAVVVNAKLGAGATSGDGYDSASGRWWIYWNQDTAHRKQTINWGHPPTGSVSGSTAIVRGHTVSYSANATDADGGMTRINFYVSPTGTLNWTSLGTTTCSGGSCSGSASWTPSAAGTYYVVIEVPDGNGLYCTGNYNNGNDLWGTPLGGNWFDCGTSSRLTVTVWQNAPSGTLSGPTSLMVGSPGYFAGTGAEPDNNLARIDYYVSPTGAPSWTLLGTTPCSGGSCSGSASWTPSAAGSYYVVANIVANNGLVCTGNYQGGTDLWGGAQAGNVVDCGATARLVVTVGTVPAPAGPPTGQTWRFYYYAGAQRIAMRTRTTASDNLQYLFGDSLGSTSVASNPDGSSPLRQSYYPWGKVRQGGGWPTDHQFTGAVADGTGLIQMGARYYDPALARFVSADTYVPASQGPQGLNRYSFVVNNPLKYTDPSGHRPCNDTMGTCQGGDGTSTSPGCLVNCSGNGFGNPTGANPLAQPTPQPNGPCLSCPSPVSTPPPIPTFSIMGLLTPSPTPGQIIKPNTSTRVGKDIAVDWSKIDYVSLIIDAAGIAGDVAEYSGTPIGALGFGLSEVAEGAGYAKSAYDYTQNGDPNGLLGVISNKALDVKFARLTPLFGFVFDAIDGVISVAPAISVIDVQTP